jgi:hypothetical protein
LASLSSTNTSGWKYYSKQQLTIAFYLFVIFLFSAGTSNAVIANNWCLKKMEN